MTKRIWLRTALLNFFIAASLGATLRYAFVEELSWLKFQHVLHAHSHVAMLGWVYLALFTLLVLTFLKPEQQSRKYSILFWLTQFSVAGMLITFPITGYAPASIAFSSLHTLLSYVFAFYFLRDIPAPSPEPHNHSRLFAKASVWFMLISTLALWATAPIIITGGKGTAWYYAAIQFFLHFQFNGWFLFAIIALLLKKLEEKGFILDTKKMRWFFWLLVISSLLTYALAVTWSNPLISIFLINSVGVAIQLVAAILITGMLWRKKILDYFEYWEGILLNTAFVCFVGKVIVQTAVVIPAIAKVGYTIRNYVIGFLHLMLLGIFSSFLLAFAADKKLLDINRLTRWGIVSFLLGFFLSEAVLFVQGTMFWGARGFLPFYYEGLFAVTLFLPIGLLIILLGQKWGKAAQEK